MSERGNQLLDTADDQISALIDLFSARGEAALSLPCPGREKLGDGTVAALALLTADRYLRIAEFLQATSQKPGARANARHRPHRNPRSLRSRAHAPRGNADSHHDEDMHDGDYTAENVDLHALLERLSAARDALSLLADLTDEKLCTVPPKGSFRFCDGQRTLEQVVASLLKHQRHQVDAMKVAMT
jgi:hypothetical protein